MTIIQEVQKYLKLLAFLLLAACSFFGPPQPSRLVLEPVSFSELPGWTNDSQDQALLAFRHSCSHWLKAPRPQRVGTDSYFGTVADWQDICADLVSVKENLSARTFFEKHFQPFKASNQGFAQGLFTGYYEPVLQGSRVRKYPYTTPLLAQPKDLVAVDLGEFRPELQGQRIAGRVVKGHLKPYEDRAVIESPVFHHHAHVLVWVKDPVEAFFLHIQGSGLVRLSDGTALHIGYAAQNGQPYTAIGRVLADEGEIPRDQVSLSTIKAWLWNHPDRARSLMQKNKSYVFFHVLSKNQDQPLGAEGVPLTPGRSLAVDRAFIPYGLPLWLETEDPLEPKALLQRLMVAQDTGGAIRGPVRGDVFWGQGEDAATRAGVMKAPGQYWLLLPQHVRAVTP